MYMDNQQELRETFQPFIDVNSSKGHITITYNLLGVPVVQQEERSLTCNKDTVPLSPL
jgi:hypothetical protein